MDISLTRRTKIFTLHQYTDKSQTEIARIVGVSQPSVSRIIQQGNDFDTLSTKRKGRCGPKFKATPPAVQKLVMESEKDSRKSSHELKRDLEMIGVSVSPRTVRRHLVAAGRVSRRPMKKQLLTDTMKERRLIWAKQLENWTKNDWRKVLFSDESHFLVQGKRSQYVRRSKGEPILDAHIEQYVKHPQKRMFWGCFSYKGVGSLYPVEGMMCADQYIDVIKRKVIKDMKDFFPNGDGIFQQDSAPCHKAKKVTKLLKEKRIQLLDWPGNSPDLNPIENLWSIIKMELRKRDCATQTKLTQAIIDIWFRDPTIEEKCLKLIDSMPKRVKQVIFNKGGHTNY